jgi:hypothetical protein
VITIALRTPASTNGGQAAGETYPADPHPTYIDLPGLEGDTYGNSTEVELHEHVAIAPLVAGLHGMVARDSTDRLDRALRAIRKKRPDRTDGIVLGTMLMSWAKVNPFGVWDVSAPARTVLASRGENGVDYSGELQPRFAESALREANVSSRPDCQGENCTLPCCQFSAGSGDADPLASGDPNGPGQRWLTSTVGDDGALRRRDASGGGGSGGRVRKDRSLSAKEINTRRARQNQDDGREKREFVGAKVAPETKKALVDDRPPTAPTNARYQDLVARAIISGRTYEEVEQGLLAMELRADAANPAA